MSADRDWLSRAAQSLDEAKRWCAARANPELDGCGLWSPDLGIPRPSCVCMSPADPRAEFERAIERRRRMLRPGEPGSSRGRILVCRFAENMHDATAAFVSKNLFNACDIAAPDTWIALGPDSDFYCWIPESLVALVQEAIPVSMMSCIWWLDDDVRPQAHELSAALGLRHGPKVDAPIASGAWHRLARFLKLA